MIFEYSTKLDSEWLQISTLLNWNFTIIDETLAYSEYNKCIYCNLNYSIYRIKNLYTKDIEKKISVLQLGCLNCFLKSAYLCKYKTEYDIFMFNKYKYHKIIALLMGKHNTLGKNSIIKDIPEDIIILIIKKYINM